MKSRNWCMDRIAHSPLLACIAGHAATSPDKVALMAGDRRVTYADLFDRICRATDSLNGLGLGPGDVIALSARKDPAFIYTYFAAHMLGLVNVIMDPEANSSRVAYILGQTAPACLFGFSFDGFRSYAYEDVVSGEGLGRPAAGRDLSVQDVVEIVYTTGTTGMPKGVQLSHHNIFSSAENINGFIGNTAEDVELIGLPLCHSFGLGRLRCTLMNGATAVLLGSFANLKGFFSAIEDYGATGFGMVPSVWAYIRQLSGTRIARYAGQIRYMEIGSAAMPLEAKEELCELFPDTRICMHYGLTEASRSAFIAFHDDRGALRSIGRPVSEQVSIKVLDGEGHELPDGGQGEICISGNMVMKGYLRPEDNQDAFWGAYFRTGDMGYKENGLFYLVGRKKEMINVGGEKVSPVEVEDAICSLGVADCMCVGMKDPGGILGEVVKAYIQVSGCPLTFEEIRSGLAGLLEPYKIPVAFEWIDRIPKTASGKKLRLSIQQICHS